MAGLQRFLLAHFRPIVNKIMPEGSPEEVEQLVRDGGDFFNKVQFDEAVQSVVNPLLVLDHLYSVGVQRSDEVTSGLFSKLSGLHMMGWQPEAKKRYIDNFNEATDKIRVGLERISTRVDASKLSKDKTRPLQFLPTAELLEAGSPLSLCGYPPGSQTKKSFLEHC